MGGTPAEQVGSPGPGGDAEREGAGVDPRYDASLARLRDELAHVVEAMDELALEVLRDAAEAGAGGRPELERRVTRARNGVERALHLLRDGDAELD